MRIGINCLTLDIKYKGGITSYTFGLLRGFASLETDHTFQIYASERNFQAFNEFARLKNFRLFLIKKSLILTAIKHLGYYLNSEPAFRVLSDIFFSPVRKTIEENSDVVYFPTTTIFPFNYRIPTYLSMHDILQLHYPEFFSEQELNKRKILFNLSARYAKFFQASSQFIKKDLLSHFPVLNQEQIEVIPEGVDISTFSNTKETNFHPGKFNIPDSYLFYPAQLWYHKNHITVLKALLILRNEKKTDFPLVLTGSKFSAYPSIMDFINKNNLKNVYYLGLVSFDDLLGLYRNARFLVNAVLYESSSIPILEAAASGIPIITSRIPPNEEMSKILKLNLFDPLDENQLAEMIFTLWNDTEKTKKQVRENSNSISYYSWVNTAKKYMKFFEK